MTERTIRQIIEGQVPVTAASTLTVTQAARVMKERNVGALMVVDENTKLVGVFTERDALFRVLADGKSGDATLLGDVMTKNPKTVGPEMPFLHALQAMHEGGFRHLPVVEDDRLLGIVSVRDALGPELESFVYELLRQEQIGEVLAQPRPRFYNADTLARTVGQRLAERFKQQVVVDNRAGAVTKLNSELVTMLQDPALRDLQVRQGMEPLTSSPEEFRAVLAEDIVQWAKVVKEAGIKAE